MTQKHTPGPWAVNPKDDQEVLGPDGEPIFWLFNDGVCATEPANARLIAAAPELLEALEYAHDYLSSSGWCGDERLDLIVAAICKARGEAT